MLSNTTLTSLAISSGDGTGDCAVIGGSRCCSEGDEDEGVNGEDANGLGGGGGLKLLRSEARLLGRLLGRSG